MAKSGNFPWLDHSPDSVLVTDAAGVIEYVNPAFEALTGYARAEAPGRTAAILKSGVQDCPAAFRSCWRRDQRPELGRGGRAPRRRRA